MYWMILPLKRYADFSGRSRRKEYWMFFLGYTLVLITIGLVAALLGAFAADPATIDPEELNSPMLLGLGAIVLVALALVIPSLAVQVRRLHDRDMSGWWLLLLYGLSVVPIVGFLASIAIIVLAILPGTRGPNRFGPDPKDPYGRLDDTDVFA